MRYLWMIVAILAIPFGLEAQWYPKWFLHQTAVSCRETAVGYALPAYYPDSAYAEAFRDAVLNFVRQKRLSVAGGQAFWSTEGGTFWMGSNIREEFDTSALGEAAAKLEIVDRFTAKSIVIVLAGPKGVRADSTGWPQGREKIAGVPSWIETLPQDDQYHYVLGVSQKYYYETSSWTVAERAARWNLARTAYVNVKSLQKMSTDGQEIRNEELSVMLTGIEVAERWKDDKKGIYYVLMRMPRK